MQRIIPILLTFALVCTICVVDCRVAVGSAPHRLDPLLWSHLVVHGTVEDVEFLAIPGQTWLPTGGYSKDALISVSRIRIHVTEVLKGQTSTRIVDVWDPNNDPRAVLKKGEEVIVCAYFNSILMGGIYTTTSSSDYFTQHGSSWVPGFRSVFDAKPPLPPGTTIRAVAEQDERLTIEQIRNRVESTAPREVTREADLVVIGRVHAVKEVPQADGAVNRHVTVDVGNSLKGDSVTSTITFVMRTSGPQDDGVWSYTPHVPKIGEQWCLFLRRSEAGLIPFAGINGMFRIDGERLVFDEEVICKYSKQQLEAIVVEEASHEH